MAAMTDLVISDSEPEECGVRFPRPSRLSPRQNSQPTSSRTTARPQVKETVMVLSSASDSGSGSGSASEGEQAKRIESRFFPDSSKRKRAASPPPIEWATMGLKGISPLDGTKRSSGSPLLMEGKPPVPVRATSTNSSSSFVSALELLRKSGSPPPKSDSPDLEPLQPLKSVRASSAVPKPRRQKQIVKAKRAASASSSEPISIRATVTKAPEESRPAKRRSVSPLSSSDGEDTQPLPGPDLWAKRFSRGSSSAAASSSLSDVKPTTTTSTTQTRTKPWEALEAKIGKVKKPPTRTTVSRHASVGARARSNSLLSAKEEEDHNSSDSDVIVTSTLPARARSRSSSSVRPRSTRPRTPLDFLPPPVELPPEDVVRVLTLCALCSITWPASKTLAAKQGHLRSCATKNDYTAETVRYLVEKQVLELADAAEQERRAVDDGKTLFDRAVGKGEGAHAMRDVTVVGVERLESAAGVEWFKATTEVQAEIDQARRKVQVAKVIKVAKQIRLDQRARAREGTEPAAAADDADGSTRDVLVMPESTGRLQPAAATLVTERADAVLARLDSSDDDPFSAALPPTQEFQRSRLAKETAGSVSSSSGLNAHSTPPPSPAPANAASPPCETASDTLMTRQSRSPFRQLSLPDPRSGSISRQGHPSQHRLEPCSLWQLAAGRDDARLGTVVLKKPSHLASVPVSPRRCAAGSSLQQQHQQQQRQSSIRRRQGMVGGRAADDSSSSEEEALAQVVERNKSSPKKCRRARSPASSSSASDLPTASSSPAVAAAAPAPALPDMPDYESLAVTTLQRKVRQYGFRASKEKDVLVAQLRQVWIAMHPTPQPGGEEATASSGKASEGTESTDSPSPKGKKTAATKAKVKAKATTAGRARTKTKTKSKDDDENASDLEVAAPEADSVPGRTVGEKLRHLIVQNEGLYLRILRYEPIHSDEFATLASANGVKIARPLLTRFLDEQSITHYLQDPTGGTRRRYR